MLLSNRFQKLGHQDERCHHLRVPAIAVMVIACLSVTVISQSEMEGDCNDNNNNRSTGPHQLYRGGGGRRVAGGALSKESDMSGTMSAIIVTFNKLTLFASSTQSIGQGGTLTDTRVALGY